ncbi:hypothetical protein [Flammeovirga kamogawensis]|uniref:VLRF1 domain-containing protein n=1 Tax=Flammeovirga kamogawensis TaxID=373891 RepID=A0ABX8H2W8_9BACT|nr:hypothetical protein [Flammeovirga kamogawensis]MBB6460240.1 hypothetical protein [Flammeovirga kamogawensis]QWG10053.1 hypothetical protein KM029_20435 [Flammeovirga kamogawensis]TRX65560.1 hypothetical protein EO216_23865 [Flammeovirga kamogawensis]
MQSRLIPSEKLEDLLHYFIASKKNYDEEKHTLNIETEQLNFALRLPWQLDKNLLPIEKTYVICLIQTESAVVGLVKNEELLSHKTFSTYAVRKKQGKSQIKYLKTRGKSKAGSRLRLANTINFFEHINERLTSFFKDEKVEKIVFSCSKILIPYLFTSKVPCPFDKKDTRIFKLPKYIPNANFEDLKETLKYLNRGELMFEDTDLPEMESLLKDLFNNQ